MVTRAAALEKYREEVSEMFRDAEPEVSPVVAERVMQIGNDAIASMPETVPEKQPEDPKEVMLKKLKDEIEKMKANTDVSDDLKAKLDQIPGAVETALEEQAPAAQEPAPATS